MKSETMVKMLSVWGDRLWWLMAVITTRWVAIRLYLRSGWVDRGGGGVKRRVFLRRFRLAIQTRVVSRNFTPKTSLEAHTKRLAGDREVISRSNSGYNTELTRGGRMHKIGLKKREIAEFERV